MFSLCVCIASRLPTHPPLAVTMTSQPPSFKPVSTPPLVFGESRAAAHITSHMTLGQTTTEPPSVGGCSRSSTISPNAMNLLLELKEEDERDVGRRRAGAMRVFGRHSPSLREEREEGNTHYSKLGILLSDEPGAPAMITPAGSELRPGLPRSCTLPSTTATSLNPTGGSSLSDVLSLSDQLTATLTETLPKVSLSCPVTNTDTSDQFEWVDVEQGDDGACLIVIHPSPPISIQSSSSTNTVHEVEDRQPSSPDSGYGITPDNVRHSGGTDGSTTSDLGATDRGQSAHRRPEQSLSRQRSGAVCEEDPVLSDMAPARNARCRGDTDNSVFSVDSGEASPGPNMSTETSPRPSVSNDSPSTSLDHRPMLKHTMSVPDNLMALNRVPCSVTAPDTIPEHAVTRPFLTSSSMSQTTGSVCERRADTFSEPHSTKEMGQRLQRHAQDHVSPSQLTALPKNRSRVMTLTSPFAHLKWSDSKRSKIRAASQPFVRASGTEVRGHLYLVVWEEVCCYTQFA